MGLVTFHWKAESRHWIVARSSVRSRPALDNIICAGMDLPHRIRLSFKPYRSDEARRRKRLVAFEEFGNRESEGALRIGPRIVD